MTPSTPQVRVVVVCLGNICRSPIGEAVLREHLAAAGLDDRVEVRSAGTAGYHEGEPADQRTTAALERAGYSHDHVATQLNEPTHGKADLILTMDSANLRDVLRMAWTDRIDVLPMRSFDPDVAEAHATDPTFDVPDPYYGDSDDFDEVVRMVEAATPGVIDHLRTQVS